MKVLKARYHIKAAIKKLVYRIVFGKQIRIGKHTTWRDGFHIAIEGNGRIDIGEKCFFNHNCSLNALNHVSIGAGTIFGENVHIYDHNHHFSNPEESIKEQGYTVGETVVGKHCWLGTNVVVLKGVSIGDNCIIGAGYIVDRDVPENTVITKNA